MAKARRDTIHDARDLPIFVVDDALIDCHGARIGPYGVAVYIALARFAKQAHTAALAYQTVADILGIGRTKARETLKALETAGLITIDPQTDDAGNPIASNRYTLLPIADNNAKSPQGGVSPHDTPVSPRDTPHAPDDTPVSPRDRGGVATRLHGHDSLLENESLPPPPTHGGGGGKQKKELTETERFLIDQGMYPANATEFRDCDLAATQKAYKQARDEGSRNGAIVKRWRLSPPRPTPAYTNGHHPTPRPDDSDANTPEETARKIKERVRG